MGRSLRINSDRCMKLEEFPWRLTNMEMSLASFSISSSITFLQSKEVNQLHNRIPQSWLALEGPTDLQVPNGQYVLRLNQRSNTHSFQCARVRSPIFQPSLTSRVPMRTLAEYECVLSSYRYEPVCAGNVASCQDHLLHDYEPRDLSWKSRDHAVAAPTSLRFQLT